jgi:Uma2 family endonuclease
VEILSPSTERDDVFIKLPDYQLIPSLQEILYLESAEIAATVYRRDGDEWHSVQIAGRDAHLILETIGLDIPLSAIYRGVPRL